MSGLIGLLNALAQAALAEQSAGAPVRLRAVTLEDDGGRVLGRVDHPAAGGEFVLRFTVEAPGQPPGAQQVLHLAVEQWPDRLPPALEPFRTLLERARLQLTLDFTPPD